MYTNSCLRNKLFIADIARMSFLPDMSFNVSIHILSSHKLFVTHIARWHFLFEVNVLEMFTESRFSVELFSTMITNQCIITVVIKHMGFQLRVLDKLLSTYVAFVISSTGVSPHVSV